MKRLLRAIKRFIFMKPARAKNKPDWQHINCRRITFWTKHISDSGHSDHSCRYKVVEGRTKKRLVQNDLDGHRIQLTPTTEKAVVLIWKYNQPIDPAPHSMERWVIHLNKRSKNKDDFLG